MLASLRDGLLEQSIPTLALTSRNISDTSDTLHAMAKSLSKSANHCTGLSDLDRRKLYFSLMCFDFLQTSSASRAALPACGSMR